MLRPLLAVLIVGSLVLAGPVAPADAAYRTFGTPRFSTTEPGDIIMAANTLLTCPASAACTAAQNGTGVPRANNDFTMIRVDVDNSLGLDPTSQTNISSAADLNLPAGAEVRFAGLYWGAVSQNAANRPNVRFSTPASGGYVALTADQIDDNGGGTTYQSFVDVTTLVQAGGAGQYVVGGIEARTGGGIHAGWSLVVAYGDVSQPYRNLSVFDGFQRVTTGNPINVTVNGFLTPPSGPVTAQIGFVTYEGDDRFAGDFAQLNGQQLNDSVNPATNFFNSRISDNGVLTTAKNPNYVDQLGFDATITNTVGVVPAGATAATITMDSAGDWYYPGVVTAAIDVYVPNLVLDLDKTVTDDNGGDVNPGDILTYDIAFSNQGDDAGLDVVLDDAIPANTTYVPGSLEVLSGDNPGAKTDAAGDDTAFFDGPGNRAVFNLGTGATATSGGRVAPFAGTGTVYQARFKVQVDAGSEGLAAVNEATLNYTGETISDNYASTTNQTISNIVSLADVKLTAKVDSVDPVLAGGALTWDIAAANDGPSTADNVVITDPLPSGLVFDPSNSDARCSVAAGTVSCLLGSMASGTTDSVTVAVDVLPSMTGGTFTNTAQISTTTQDRSTADDLATEQTTVERLVDLEVTKIETPNPLSPPEAAIAGERIDYSVTVANNGPATANNVVLTDLLPAGVTVVSSTPEAACTATAGSIECNWATIAVGAFETLNVTVELDPGQGEGTSVTNSASATADEPEVAGGGPNSASVSTPIDTSADLSLTKTTTDPAIAGETLTWDLVVANNGPSHAQNVTVTDTLPTGTTFVVGLSSSGCSEAAGVVTCVIPQIDSGSSSAFSIGVRINQTANSGSDITNTAVASADTQDPDGSNNSASDTVTVSRVADVAILKSGPGTVSAGSQIEYTLEVTNAGPSAAANLQITDSLPPELVFNSAPGCSGTTVITCDVANLAVGASTTFTITADVPSTVPDGVDLVNVASVSADESDPNSANDSSQLTTTTDRTTLLELTKNESPGVTDPVLAGEPVSWDLNLTNLSSSTDTNVVITDDLSGQPVAGPVTATVTGAPGSCSVSGLAVSCSIPTLDGNTSALVVVTATADPSANSGDVISNTANADGDFSAPVTGIEETTINAQSDLRLIKSGPATIAAGETGVWTIVVTNDGPAQAKAIEVADLLPTGVTYISSSTTPGSIACDPVGANVNCTVGTLDPGATATIDITARVERTSAAGPIANAASVTSSTSDPDPASNSGSVPTSVSRSADLELTKAAISPSTNAGGTISFALTANNLGPSMATGVELVDTLDPAFVFNSALSDSACSQTGSTVTCVAGDLDPLNAPTTFNVTFDVDSAQAAGTYTNSASISATETDSDTTNNAASADFVVDALADMSVAKTSPATPAVPGETYEYVIDVTNNGPSDALANSVTDTLPAGTSLAAGSSPACSEAPSGTVTCVLGNLAPAESASIVIVVDIEPTRTGSLNNSAVVNSDTADPDTSNNQSSDSTPLIPAANIQLDKTAPATVNAGGTITWSLLVTNAGASTATGTEITDTLPAGVTFSGASNPLCSATGSNVSCSLPDIAPGDSVSVDIVANVDVTAVEGSLLTNNAQASSDVADPDTTNNSSSASSRIERSADVSLTKTATGNVVAGGTATYELRLTNSGPSAASAVSLTDTFVPELTPISATPVGGTCSISGQTVTCSASQLLPGQSVQATITASVDSGASVGDIITNSATSSAAEPDPAPGNNSASASVTVEREADLALAKTASQPTGVAGDTVQWLLQVNNLGPSDATGISVSDVLGPERTFDAAGSSPECSLSGTTVTCTQASLADGASAVFTVSTTLSSDLADGSAVSNTATVSANETDNQAGNNSATGTVTVSTSADLSLTKSSPPTPPVPGSTAVWPVAVTNNGPSDAVSVVVTDTLPSGTTFNPGQSAPTCSLASPGVVECSISSISSGGTSDLSIAADISSSLIGSVTNTASVSSSTDDPFAGNNSDSTTESLVPTADLSVTKSAVTDPVVAGQDAQWLVEITNLGPSDASGVTLTDALGPDLVYLDAPSDPRCDPVGGDIECGIGMIQAGTSTSLSIVSRLSTSVFDGETVTNQATVTSTSDDPDSANDQASASTTVVRQADLSITKTSVAASVNAGALASWDIVVVNNGPSDATNIVVSDILPAGASFDAGSSTSSCSETGGTITCGVSDLVNGSGANLTIAMFTPTDLVAGSSFSNTATVAGSDADPDSTNDASTDSVGITREADLSVNKTAPGTAPVPGSTTAWDVEVTNLGPSDATTVTVTDTLAPNVDFDAAGSDSSCSEVTPGVVSCSIAAIPAGATGTVTISALIPANQTGNLSNDAQANASESDPNAANNSDTVTSPLAPQADLETVKTLLTSPVVAGDLVTWSIAVTNAGPSDAAEVIVTDVFDSAMTFSPGSSDARCSLAGSVVSCDLGSIAAGSTATANVAFDLAPSAIGGSTINNSASAQATTDDPDATNNNASAQGTVTQGSDLSVTKLANSSTAVAGQGTSFQVLVANSGPSDATNVVVTDPVPAGATFDPTDSSSSCSPSGADVVCSISAIASGSSETVRIAFELEQDFADGNQLINTASASADQTDPDSSNNSGTAAVDVIRAADLFVTKSLNGQAVPGALAQWSVGVINTGPSQATDVTVTDTLSPRTTFAPGASSPGCVEISPGVVTCTFASIDSGSSSSVIIAAVVDSDATGNITNTATAAGNETDPNSNNDTASTTSALSPSANLVVSKTLDTSPVVAGGEALWTVTVENLGPSDARNVLVEDAPDSISTFVPANSDPSCTDGSPVTCTSPSIAAGSSESFVLAFAIDATTGDGTQVTNSALANSSIADPDNSDNIVTTTGTVTTSADLSLAKFSLTPNPVAGDSVTWQLSVNNPGPSEASQVLVSDPVPNGLTFDPGASDAACSLNGAVVECSFGSLSSGATTTADVTFAVDPDAADGAAITNSATVGSSTPDPDSSNNTANNTISPSRSADLRVVKNHSGPAIAGELTSWTLAATNLGPSDATSVEILDALPSDVTFNSGASDSRCSESTPGNVICVIGFLGSGAGTSVVIAGDLTPDANGQITNNASISASETDPDLANNTDSSTVDVDSSADLAITKTLVTTNPTPGQPVEWEISVTNLGPSDSTSIQVTDSFGPDLEFDPATSDSRCSAATAGSAVCALANLPAGASTNFAIGFNSSPTIFDNATLTNNAATIAATTDPNPANDTATSEAVFVRQSDLEVSKVGPASAVAGEIISYDLTFINIGPSQADNPTLADALPTAINNASVSGHPSCVVSASTVTCSPATLAPGETITATVSGTVGADTADNASLINTASASSDSADPQPANNSDSVSTAVTREVDLEMTKTLLGAIVAGREVLWELSVTNSGPSDASDLVITDTLPTGLTFRSDLSSAGCSDGVTCTVDLLPSGQTVSVIVGSDADPGLALGDTLTNTASVASAETEIDPASNESSASGTVVRETNLSVFKQGPSAPITAGTSFDWTLEVANAGPSDGSGVATIDNLPSGTTFDPANSDPRCSAVGAAVTCDFGTLSVSATDTAIVAVNVSSSVNDGDVLTNSASVSADQGDPDTTDNTSTHSVDIARDSGLTLAKTDLADPVLAGEQVTWSVNVGNPFGPSDTDNVVVTDTLPSGATFDSAASDPACSAVGSAVSCDLGTVAVGESISVAIVADLDPALAEGTILSNQATVSGDGSPSASATEETTVSRDADLSVNKTASTPTVTPGVPLTYEISVVNDGPSDASTVSLIDALPPGSVIDSVEPSEQCVASAGAVTCEFATLEAGSSQLITIDVTPEPWLVDGSNFDNNVAVSAAEPDSNGANDTGQSETPVERLVDVAITKTTSDPNASAGDSVIYDIVASNAGPSDADGLTVTDVLPAGTAFNPGLSSPGCSLTGAAVSCPLPSVAAGSTGSVSIGIDIDPSTTGTITNAAEVATVETNTNTDPTASTDVVVSELADLSLTKSTASTVVAGESLTFSLQVLNNGPGLARDVVITDELPSELTINSLDSGCSAAGQVVTCQIGDLAVGETSTVVLDSLVDPAATQPVTNTAVVSSSASETAQADNVASTSTTVSQTADLSVSKAAVSNDAVAGGQITWLIEILNQGPSVATDVVVTDLLPETLTFSSPGSSPRCTATGQTVECSVADITPGETATINLVTDVTGLAFGVITNTASAQSAETDPNPATATANAAVEVRRPSAELTVTKSGSKSPLKAGDLVTWAVVITNTGPEPILSPITVSDAIPRGHVLQSIVPGSPICVETKEADKQPVIECELDGLPAGESIELRIRTKVTADQKLAINTVVVSASGLEGGSGDDAIVTATATAQVSASAGLAFTGSSLRLMLTLAFGLMLVGYFFLVMGKRRKDDDEPPVEEDGTSRLAGL